MGSWPYLFTLTSLIIYTVSSYLNGETFEWLHGLYILLLILYNNSVSQTDPKFSHLHPLPAPEPSPSNLSQPYCKICLALKPPRYYHCRRCNLCIFQMDHHCDWLNCCVGQFNCKIYIHILFNLFFLGCSCILEALIEGGSWLDGRRVVKMAVSVFLIWQVVQVSIGLGEMVVKNQTLIETYKRVKGTRKGAMAKLEQIFGGPLGLSWFISTYANCQKCDIWQKVWPTSKHSPQQIPEMTYADEYLYGPDDPSPETPAKTQ